MWITQKPQRRRDRWRFLKSLEAGDAGAATQRWPLATQLLTKMGKIHFFQDKTIVSYSSSHFGMSTILIPS